MNFYALYLSTFICRENVLDTDWTEIDSVGCLGAVNHRVFLRPAGFRRISENL